MPQAPTFYPSDRCGTYRIPKRIFELLSIRLRGFKNREGAHKLAAFLARMNAAPIRFGQPFPVDRRALAINDTLGMNEYAIRGALKTLEAVGFIDREPEQASAYQRTFPTLAQPKGGVKRRPIKFKFGLDFVALFSWIAKKCLARMSCPKGISDLSYQNYNPLKREGFMSKVSLGQKGDAVIARMLALGKTRS